MAKKQNRRKKKKEETKSEKEDERINSEAMAENSSPEDENASNDSEEATSGDSDANGIDPPSVIISANSMDETSTVYNDDYFYYGSRGRRYCLSTLRFFGLAIFLWVSQYVLTSSIRSFGLEEEISFDLHFDPTAVAQRALRDFDPSAVAQRALPQQWKNFLNESLGATYHTKESQRPGYILAQQGATANFPVVMIPGFVTSGLEVWTSRECAKKYFRQRIWTGIESARALFADKHCWREHLALDPFTGSDPENIRLRASEGFEAADYFMANYWVWEKLLENLADVGYSPSTMSIEPYDWRLSFPLLEERDGYLTKLKYKIEAMKKSTGKKVVLASHSMGGQLVHFFFKWVTTPENEGGGGGGKKWVDEHLHAYSNIAGSHLGVIKSTSALLSGEMRDTVILGTIGAMAEQFFGRKLRKDLWNTWGSLWSMLPKGGDRIWGIGADICYNVTDAENDPFCRYYKPATKHKNKNKKTPPDLVPFLQLKNAEESLEDEEVCGIDDNNNAVCENETIFEIPHDNDDVNATISRFSQTELHSFSEVQQFLQEWGAGLGPSLASAKMYENYGNPKKKRRDKPKIEWMDVSQTPLPYAPNLKIYCQYGVGLDTERGYFYKVNNEETEKVGQENASAKGHKNINVELPFVLDLDVEDPERNIKHGMKFVDGDGSLPVLSTGYTCADAWNRKSSGLNPSGTKVITLEYKHQQEFTADDPFRGGPRSAEHVDILGNIGMMEDFLRVATDFDPPKENHIVSNLLEIVKEVNAHPNGGFFKNKKR